MRSVLYTDVLEISVIDELGEADANDESNGKHNETSQDDSDSEDPLGHGLTDEHHRRSHLSAAVGLSVRRGLSEFDLLFCVCIHSCRRLHRAINYRSLNSSECQRTPNVSLSRTTSVMR